MSRGLAVVATRPGTLKFMKSALDQIYDGAKRLFE